MPGVSVKLKETWAQTNVATAATGELEVLKGDERVRTSSLGWRIVACGTLALIIGFSAWANNVGPGWFGLLLIVGGTLTMIIGRQTRV
jgi:uncharacterized protein (DUF39 family)